MLVLVRGDGDLDFLPVWPECVGLLCDIHLDLRYAPFSAEKPHDTTTDHALYLLGRREVKPPWLFQVTQHRTGLGWSHTFTIDRIAESWILRINTKPATRFFLPEYQPDLGLLFDPPRITDVLGRPKKQTVWDRLG
jgi:hypothetical protein